MAENYKLVSEDEWQAMVDRAEVAEGWSEHWRERAERAEKSKRQLATLLDEKADREEPVRADGGEDPVAYWVGPSGTHEKRPWLEDSGVVDGAVKIPGSDNPTRPRNGEKNWLWRYDADGNLIWSGPPELAPAFGESETDLHDNAERMIQEPSRPWTYSVPVGFTELRDGGPQRPHASLVWAIYHAAAYQESHIRGASRLVADEFLKEWRARWPESTD